MSLVAWSCVTFVLLADKKWLTFCAGFVLLLWGITIPLRESLSTWLENPGIQSMLQVASGNFSKEHRVALEQLVAERPTDGVVLYTYGQLLRKYGELDRAAAVMESASEHLGKQPWTDAQLGIISFLKSDFGAADKYFELAEKKALKCGILSKLL